MFLIAVAMGCIFRYTPDHDVYHHLTLGRYIVENHAIPKTNPFVIHDGFKSRSRRVHIASAQVYGTVTGHTNCSVAFKATGLRRHLLKTHA